MGIAGGVLIPIGLFWFAWCVLMPLYYSFQPLMYDARRTATPSIHWIVPILAGIPFGAGVAQILQCLTTYLMDTYPMYFASSIAATVVLRSCCGAAFPLFSPAMFKALGDAWAMSVFAFLAAACMPIPILFYVSTRKTAPCVVQHPDLILMQKYGAWIRSKSRVAFKDADPTRQPPPTSETTSTSQIQEKKGSDVCYIPGETRP